MIKIVLHDAPGFSASSHYRMHQPMRLFRDKVNLVTLNSSSSIHEELYKSDILAIIRPNGWQDQLDLIKLAKWIGLPVWIDLDDNVWNIMPWSTAYSHYTSKEQAVINECLKLADLVTVTTDALQELCFPFNKSTVIPNAVDPFYAVSPENILLNKVCWRGTATHNKDLDTGKEYFKEWSKTREIHFHGYIPGWDDFAYDHHAGFIPFHEFQEKLKLSADFMFFPLRNDIFNRCKSNISLLESVLSGMGYYSNVDFPHFYSHITHVSKLSKNYNPEHKIAQHNSLKRIVERDYNINEWAEYRFELINQL